MEKRLEIIYNRLENIETYEYEYMEALEAIKEKYPQFTQYQRAGVDVIDENNITINFIAIDNNCNEFIVKAFCKIYNDDLTNLNETLDARIEYIDCEPMLLFNDNIMSNLLNLNIRG